MLQVAKKVKPFRTVVFRCTESSFSAMLLFILYGECTKKNGIFSKRGVCMCVRACIKLMHCDLICHIFVDIC